MTEAVLYQRVESLLNSLAPGVAARIEVPLLGMEPEQGRYEVVEANRLRLSRLLCGNLRLVHRHRAELLALLPLDHGLTSQLVFPLVTALGRRPVLQYLIDAARQGECAHRTNASSAACWVGRGPDIPHQEEIFTALRDGVMSVAEARGELRRQREESAQGNSDHIADLWPDLWLASMKAFVDCDDDELRLRLHTAFPLAATHYPPGAASLRDHAERIALAQPETFRRLLDGSTGYGLAI